MPPKLRSMSSIDKIEELLDKKIGDLATKESIGEIRKLLLEQREKLVHQEEMIKGLKDELSSQNDKIIKMESTVALLKNSVNLLQRDKENSEQYSRRLCLRIYGIETEQNEDGNKCLEKAKKVINELGVIVPDECIDRAHRIGKVKNENGKKEQGMIVRFTTWRHRTLVYNARKNGEKKYGIKLDMTKQRLDVLTKCREYLESQDDSGVNFVCVDVNCRLTAKRSNGKFFFLRYIG